jgi:uncharacterized repeat protein (TIGR04138 family)
MKDSRSLDRKLDSILEEDPRFRREAYLFTLNALDYTLGKLDKPRHVTGQELLAGIKAYGQEQFGALCLTVFTTWGITQTENFGEIVFKLVNSGLLAKTENDSLDDFRDVFDLQEMLPDQKNIKVDYNRLKNLLHRQQGP